MAIHPFTYCLLMVVFLQSILTQDLDIAYSGNYLIRNCNAGQPGSYAEQLQNLLPLIRNTLQDVIADAFLGTASSHGFATFFRSNDNIAYVQRLYRLISQGPSAPLPEADSGTPMPRFTSGQPTIICVQPNGESDDHHGDIEWLITQCASEETHFFFAGLVKGEQGDRYIMLCPRFWDSSELGTVALHRECPKVRRNTLTPWGIELALNWHHILVEEMVHLYGAVGHEEYAINDVANVPDADVLNAGSNWAYYYSAVQANCTSWPNMNYPHDNLPQPSNLRGLLEAPNASSLLKGSDYSTQNITLSVGSNTSVLPVQPRKALD